MKKFILLLSIGLLIGCQSGVETTTNLKTNLELASMYFNEIYNENKLDLIDEIFIEDYSHTTTEGKKLNHRDELKEAIKRIKSLLPNLKTEIVESTVDDQKVMFLIKMESDLPEIANPNTKATSIVFQETFIFWIQDDKIVKGRTSGSHLSFIKQASGFEGSVIDMIKTLTECINNKNS